MSRPHSLQEVVNAIGPHELSIVDRRLKAKAVLDGSPIQAEPNVLFERERVAHPHASERQALLILEVRNLFSQALA